jgi:hypothetical protein
MERMEIEIREMPAQQIVMVDTQTTMMNAQTGTIRTSSTACGRCPLSDIVLITFCCYGIILFVDIVVFF